MARPETLKTSLATAANLISSDLSSRWLRRLAFDELTAIAQKIAQLPQQMRRYEVFSDQAVADQVGNPLASFTSVL